MKTHLRRHHNIKVKTGETKDQAEVSKQLQQLYYQAEASGDTKELDEEILKKALQRSVITEALITLIVVRNLSFCIVEWPEFQTFCQVINPEVKGIIPTTHSTIRNWTYNTFIRYKDVVVRLLQSAASSIHISLDIWTSPNRWLLLAIVAHFTTADLKRQRALLALKKVPGHSGGDQFSILLPVLQDYGIVRKLGAIIADNASPNGTLCNTIEEYWEEELDLEWKASDWRIRCIGHIINLVVQAFLFAKVVTMEELDTYDEEDRNFDSSDDEARRARFRLLGPLGQAHNVNAHIRKSPLRAEVFRKLAGRLIPMDNRTRWNSWYEELLWLLNLREHVEKYCRLYEDELEKDLLGPQDWKKLKMIKDFLSVFVRATLTGEGHATSIDSTLFLFDVIIKHIQKTTVRGLLPTLLF
jgi:hypothetical protein